MERIFNLQRTKMIDEAAKGHTPLTAFKYILYFIIVQAVGTFITSVIQTVPTLIYLFSSKDFMKAVMELANGSISEEQFGIQIDSVASILPPWLVVVSLFSTVGIIAASIFYCVKMEKRPLSSMGIRKKNIVSEYLIGALIGAVMFSLSFLIAYLTGSLTVAVAKDISVFYIIIFLLGFIVQGASEEILLRGYLMVSMARDYRAAVAVGFSSVLFSLLHIGNTGFGIIPFINITLFGIFMGIYVYKRGNLWGACAIHSVWNFAQGNIFGVSVSGMPPMPSVLVSVSNSKTIANGGEFGLEGGVCVTIVLVVSILLSMLLKTKKDEISETQVEYFSNYSENIQN